MLVDDREDNLFSIQTVLEKDNYHFSTANSGKQALKILLKEYDFTLILMDVEMPDLNGFETAALIYEREKLKHIPIIFITANNYSEEYVYKGYSSGAVDYIYKPINPQLLRAKVAVFVDLYKKNHLLRAQEQRLQEINVELESRVHERTEELFKKNIELENSNKELVKVNNDLDNFVYTASHDLKSPVSNIEGLVTALKTTLQDHQYQNEDVEMLFEMIDKSIAQFKATIHELSEISKIQKNLDDDVAVVDIKEILEEISVSISEFILQSEAEITVDLKDGSNIRYSRKNLKSILLNLLTNAIKYRSEDRSLKINISSQLKDNALIVSVKDNGIGIDSEDVPKIFRMFKRLHTHVEGTGVGLYIVKRILDNSGDSIEVEGKVGEGCNFSLIFRDKV